MSNKKLEFEVEEEQEDLWYRAFIFSDVRPHDFIEAAKTRAPKEIGCAFAASFLVSPLVSIIDKCIVQDISGSAKFLIAIRNATHEMVAKPRVFFGGLSFRLTFAVYFGTYAVANLSEMFLDVQKIRNDEARKQRKVAASAVANISLLAWRDSVFAKVFGCPEAAKRKTPLRTFGLFAARDTATMYATFYAAPSVAKYLEHERGWERNTAELTMALAIPVSAQILTAPLHIHAMDYFNFPEATTADRFATIRKEFATVSFARGLRILPAFGIGSFSNNKFRELFIRGQDERKFYRKRLTTLYNAARRKVTSSRGS
ncbi:hypothetical protein FisN_3Lh049 [Fistulifera solaris]|uniref:Uncharacterized protein n=1 Tax=Fistulifera solaris TaxID=1519565 RepID=A0A1Z5JYL5_FISSO|nr:hypothetical protein FisN_3Lh049 [Fistulifera solaris]|eukprot:GAX19110.1 hypothetical protein FisN_3Lh049 [Fistulifera solaris]